MAPSNYTVNKTKKKINLFELNEISSPLMYLLPLYKKLAPSNYTPAAQNKRPTAIAWRSERGERSEGSEGT